MEIFFREIKVKIKNFKCHPNTLPGGDGGEVSNTDLHIFVSDNCHLVKTLKLINKKPLYNEHYPSILVTILRESERFSGKNRALRCSILVGKQKHNVQKPGE